MNRANVKLILLREVRDQLRDRRTLFMIAVLPLLLYPLLGMSFFQIAQFMRERPTKVLIVGLPKLEDLPPLVDGDHFATDLFLPHERHPPAGGHQPDGEQPASDDDQHYAHSQSRLLKLDLRELPREAGKNVAEDAGHEQTAEGASRPDDAGWAAEQDTARAQLAQGSYEAVVVFPPDFRERLEQFRAGL